MGSIVHTIPLADLIEHVTDGDACPCGPEVVPVECDDGSIGYDIVHFSLDGREFKDYDYAGPPMPKEKSYD